MEKMFEQKRFRYLLYYIDAVSYTHLDVYKRQASDGHAAHEVVGVVCWTREMPKGSTFRYVTGIQLRFGDSEERAEMQDYVAYVKKRYKL